MQTAVELDRSLAAGEGSAAAARETSQSPPTSDCSSTPLLTCSLSLAPATAVQQRSDCNKQDT